MTDEYITDYIEQHGWKRGRGGLCEQWLDPLRPSYSSLHNAYDIQRYRSRNPKRWRSGYWQGVARGASLRRPSS